MFDDRDSIIRVALARWPMLFCLSKSWISLRKNKTRPIRTVQVTSEARQLLVCKNSRTGDALTPMKKISPRKRHLPLASGPSVVGPTRGLACCTWDSTLLPNAFVEALAEAESALRLETYSALSHIDRAIVPPGVCQLLEVNKDTPHCHETIT